MLASARDPAEPIRACAFMTLSTVPHQGHKPAEARVRREGDRRAPYQHGCRPTLEERRPQIGERRLRCSCCTVGGEESSGVGGAARGPLALWERVPG